MRYVYNNVTERYTKLVKKIKGYIPLKVIYKTKKTKNFDER